ncbi:DUF2716 domain-containing protein [Alkalihalobacterium chitinilyticum]|uniref:DUF2716 domain-containing protein n=1 Tax=Alkalihalobacterium chitinilyticum TaxID=2980103 RepID=A0ABT5VFM4_9BACI|nr:DUF2716 domain-containing protein [Alkalihalobacterium chitinilyticum]MDE5414265.1 DUF2716 domain-containing protein [Alkalihalobacterium chitinilyticum]
MENWLVLTKSERDKVWNKVYDDLKFKPSITYFPSFQVPSPYITFDISHYFRQSEDMNAYDDLEEKALLVFQQNTLKDESIYALNWQHECYWVNPHLELKKDEFNEWKVPIFPNGDYYFFIHKNFRWGYLGHPWEKTVTVFGKEVVTAFKKHQPIMFQRILRQG